MFIIGVMSKSMAADCVGPPLEVSPPRPPEREPRPVAAPRGPIVGRTARHRIDPLAPPPAKGKRFGRRGEVTTGDADVVDGPPTRRLLPTQATGED